MSKTNDRDYQYQLKIGGEDWMTGDAYSIGIIFANLTGRNYTDKPAQEYELYMAWMEHYYERKLAGPIELLSPEGNQLNSGVIGQFFNSPTAATPT